MYECIAMQHVIIVLHVDCVDSKQEMSILAVHTEKQLSKEATKL